MSKTFIPDWTLIGKFLCKACNQKEEQQVEQLRNTEEAFNEALQDAENLWGHSNSFGKKGRLSVSEDHLNNCITAMKGRFYETSLPDYSSSDENKPIVKSRKLLSPWLRIAASILVLFMALGGLYFSGIVNFDQPQWVAYQTPSGERKHFALPDGSEVWLNGESSIRFLSGFEGKKRELVLAGEAFFKVKQIDEKPFVVKAGNTTTEVTGTSFGLRAYEGDSLVNLSVLEGSVNFYASSSKRNELTANQSLTYHTITSELVLSEGEVTEETAWKEGKLLFRNTSLGEITKTLSRWHGVEVTLADQTLATMNFSSTEGDFSQKPLTETLEIIALTLNLSVEQQTDGYLLKAN